MRTGVATRGGDDGLEQHRRTTGARRADAGDDGVIRPVEGAVRRHPQQQVLLEVGGPVRNPSAQRTASRAGSARSPARRAKNATVSTWSAAPPGRPSRSRTASSTDARSTLLTRVHVGAREDARWRSRSRGRFRDAAADRRGAARSLPRRRARDEHAAPGLGARDGAKHVDRHGTGGTPAGAPIVPSTTRSVAASCTSRGAKGAGSAGASRAGAGGAAGGAAGGSARRARAPASQQAGPDRPDDGAAHPRIVPARRGGQAPGPRSADRMRRPMTTSTPHPTRYGRNGSSRWRMTNRRYA